MVAYRNCCNKNKLQNSRVLIINKIGNISGADGGSYRACVKKIKIYTVIIHELQDSHVLIVNSLTYNYKKIK